MIQLLLLAAVVVLSYVVNKILIKFSSRIGTLAQGDSGQVQQIRWASHSKPLVGGIAFFLIFLLFSLTYPLLTTFSSAVPGQPEPYLPFVLAVTLGFFVGLADDAYTTKPFLKFLGQFGCGVIFIGFGLSINLFATPWLDYPLTLFWVIGIMNSINMLDNMDGITGSVTLGFLASTFGIMHLLGPELGLPQGIFYWLTLTLVATMIGFLILNWKPSKLFMGDTGSQFLGALLAFYGIQYYWNQPTGSGEIIFSRNFLLPVLAFLMPIMDTTFVTIARMRRGQSPFVGGKDHITHHLFYFGVHEKMIPVVTLSVTLLSGILNFTILKVIGNSWSHVETFLFGGYIALMFGIFLYIYQTGLKMNKERTARLKTDEAQRQEILKVVQPEKAKILEKVIG